MNLPTLRPFLLGILLALPLRTPAQVVINEIFYHAPGDLDGLQYVEIHNAGAAAVDLGGWSFSQGIQFTFPAGSRIDSGGFAVVARDAELFGKHYPTKLAGTFTARLKRKGERVELKDAAGRPVDAVKFSDRAPWATGADGHSGSLERISPGAAGDDPANWMASPLSDHREKPTGTPGRTNAAYSAKLPPVITAVRFSPELPGPDQPVTVEADLRAGEAPVSVNLRYRLAGPGFEREEVVVPMPGTAPGRFAASLPGQTAGALIRFRVEAVGSSGARRFFPAPTEPRPALSAYVAGPVEPARVPFAWVIHTTEKEMKSAEERANAPVFGEFRAPPPDPEREAREGARRMFEARLDLSPLWFQLTVRLASDPSQLAQWRPWMKERLEERRKLVEAGLAGGELASRLPRLSEMATEFVDRTLEQAASRLPDAARQSLLAWAKARPERWESGERLVATRVDLEGAWHAVSLAAEPDPARLPDVLKALQEVDRQRTVIVEEVLAGTGKNRAYRDQRDRADELGGTIGRVLQPLVTPAQAEQLEAWGKQPREVVVGLREAPRGGRGGRPGGPFGPGGPRFFGGPMGGAPSEPGSFRSAFVYFDPATRKTRLFDFVQITGRKGGQKVHLYSDDPLDGMTTFGLIFEGATAALVEPLAYEVYRRAGMPAEQSRHVRLWQNGRLTGYTVLVEQPNRAFLRRHQIKDDGTMYKLLWFGGDLIGQHEKHTRRNEGHEDLIRLMEGLEKSSGNAQWEYIRKNFDVDEVATYFAVNMVLSHWDGFFNNYFTYHDSGGTGKWLMFPWDQDSTWGLRGGFGQEGVYFNMALTFGMNGDTAPEDGGGMWRPPGFFSGPLLANPEFRRVFLRRTRDLLENVYTEAALGPVLDDLEARLTPEVRLRAEASGQDAADALGLLKSDLARCRQHLRLRREFLLAQPELKQLPR